MNQLGSSIVFALFGTGILLSSCGNPERADHPVLAVSLEETPSSIFDFFDKVEVIPIATKHENLFSYVDNIKVYNDTIYLFDRALDAVYLFAPDGSYIRRIRKVGRGYGEYPMASDFTVDPTTRTIRILNPMGEILDYDFSGTFLGKVRLPRQPKNYRLIEVLDSAHYVTWSSVYEKDKAGVNVFDATGNEIVQGYFPYSTLWSSLRYGSVFNRYRDTTYYHESFSKKVYSLTSDGCRIAYEWAMDVPLDEWKPQIPIEETPAAQQRLFEQFRNGRIPFFFGPQLQSQRYCYTVLTFSDPVVRKSLFYDKTTKESRLFAKTKEGISLDLKYMDDRYALGVLSYADREHYKGIVSEQDAILLDMMQEDDNVWLIRFYNR